MTTEVRRVVLIGAILAMLVLAGMFLPVPSLVLAPLFSFVPWAVLMAWGILDAAVHPDSAWDAADQNKIVWVLVQLIPVIGTVAYYVLIHRAVVDASNRRRRQGDVPPTASPLSQR